MKRICIVLLALVTALSCMPALAAEGDAFLGHTETETLYYNYGFNVGDTFYMVGFADMASYHVGDGDMVQYEYDISELEGDGSYDVATFPFAEGDRLYALNLITEYTDTAEFKGASLAEMTLRDDGTVAFSDICDVDWSGMVEYYEEAAYPIRPEYILGVNGQAFVRYYDTQGDFRTVAVRLSDGGLTDVELLDGAYCITPYQDGTLLAEFYDYNQAESVQFAIYDPAADSLQQLCELEIDDYSPLVGMAYDPDTDTAYCVKGGEIHPLDLQAGEILEGVTDMPLETYASIPACILDGGFYAFCSDGAVIRNLDPAQQAQSKLKINDISWNDSVTKAYYQFANAHGDVSAVLSHDYAESEKLVESMMNRDDSIDVYVLSTSTAAYDAVFNRGYLMELDGSEKVAALPKACIPRFGRASPIAAIWWACRCRSTPGRWASMKGRWRCWA